MQKPGRNDPCPCGSGKKFKKCCELKAAPKKIQAEVLTDQKAAGLSSFFQRVVVPPKLSAHDYPTEEKHIEM